MLSSGLVAFFGSARRSHSSVPTRVLTRLPRAVAVKDGRLLRPPAGLVLDGREQRRPCGRRGSTEGRRIKRWKHEGVPDATQASLDRMPEAMGVRRQTVEHPFGTLKAWMGATHFLTRTVDKVRTEMSLHVLAYNLKRMITIFGAAPLMAAIRT